MDFPPTQVGGWVGEIHPRRPLTHPPLSPGWVSRVVASLPVSDVFELPGRLERAPAVNAEDMSSGDEASMPLRPPGRPQRAAAGKPKRPAPAKAAAQSGKRKAPAVSKAAASAQPPAAAKPPARKRGRPPCDPEPASASTTGSLALCAGGSSMVRLFTQQACGKGESLRPARAAA